MPFVTSVGRAISAASLFFVFAVAQTCYYPDGQTVSDHTPCNTTASASSCCSSDSFCMSNGLCFGDGIVSRGSCTDKTWNSPECAGYCKTDNQSGSISITPCGADTFVCGLNSTDCQTNSNVFNMTSGSSLVLRTSQIDALVESATSSATEATVTASASEIATSANKVYTSSDMAGLGCGLGLPLFFALCAALFFLHKERQKHARPKLMYKLPDDCVDEYTFRTPRRVQSPAAWSPQGVGANRLPSRPQSLRTMSSDKPAHLQNFVERYEAMKKKGEIQGNQRYELGTSLSLQDIKRHELDSPSHSFQDLKRHELGEFRASP